ncbi:glycoside hydrolase family 3 protein [Streptacidiphilus pinicola]|uniref:Glycoside hydrolase family 3 protein n=1 Tax=Streptacidiphilus pinicola TaxID=2219663 RepID=A0A2X0ISN5_9ACTN|nr:glycoside hydrolase family 3 protein [Streptacidiphilus pinicola]RAG86271.1 glycoside hydrolase family 3 protein [Streptacidiphilus pinicola]
MTNPGPDTVQLLADAGAVLQPGFSGLTAPEWVRRHLDSGELGGVALFGRNIADPAQVAALTSSLYALNPDVLIATDEEGGDVTRLEAVSGSSYPGNLALGAVDDVALTEEVARSIGFDLAAAGINLNYAPDADVNTNPDNPVIGVRSFGGDGELAARHTAAYVRGVQSAGVAACAKHFPGHGDTAADSHLGLPRIDLAAEGFSEHLVPFKAAVAADVKGIMTAHILFPAYDPDLPATMSRAILHDLLRNELGYQGLIVTDGIEMGAISGTHGIAEGTVKAIAVGADTICVGGGLEDEATFRYLRDALLWAVREGRLPEDRLHEAAERNRAVARWSAKLRRENTATAVPGIGLAAARRALRVHGALTPLHGVPHVVEFSPAANFAVGSETPWGVAGPLSEFLPGTTTARVGAPVARLETAGLIHTAVDAGDGQVDTKPLLGAAVGRPLVIVVRDLHRHPWMQRATLELTASRPDAVVVEIGTAYGVDSVLADRGVTTLTTYGGARVCGVAAAEALAGPGAQVARIA